MMPTVTLGLLQLTTYAGPDGWAIAAVTFVGRARGQSIEGLDPIVRLLAYFGAEPDDDDAERVAA